MPPCHRDAAADDEEEEEDEEEEDAEGVSSIITYSVVESPNFTTSPLLIST